MALTNAFHRNCRIRDFAKHLLPPPRISLASHDQSDAPYAGFPARPPHAAHRVPCRPHCTMSSKHQIIQLSQFSHRMDDFDVKFLPRPASLSHPTTSQTRRTQGCRHVLPMSRIVCHAVHTVRGAANTKSFQRAIFQQNRQVDLNHFKTRTNCGTPAHRRGPGVLVPCAPSTAYVLRGKDKGAEGVEPNQALSSKRDWG